jgi:predicted ABC-type transport system involved in lysophospholipase L1 biosynthesis ATPase subunit
VPSSLDRERRVTVALVTVDAHAAASGGRNLELRDGQLVREVHAPRDGGR